MYPKEFRDKVYEEQNDNPPRTAVEHKENAINRLSERLPENMKGKHILDYGCGNGHIGESFLKKGADVDFAEISNKMVDLLKKKYKYLCEIGITLDEDTSLGQANVFHVESPKDLPVEDGNYDYIITWALFHHISPNVRKDFLNKFGELLKKDGKIVVAGRDETDIVLKQDEYKGHVTGQPSFKINDLPKYLDPNIFEIEETGLIDEKLPAFDIPRIFRYFIVIKK